MENGILSMLPAGFRFHPTDEELVVHYLTPKVFNCILPASEVREIDTVFKLDPWDLPGGSEDEDMYFFTTREVKNGKRWNRATASGYWKATGADKRIAVPKEHHLVGMKKTLVFYKGKLPANAGKTDWVMHEFRLAAAATAAPQGKWVLCKIFMKKKGEKNDEGSTTATRGARAKPTFRDFFASERADLNQTPASSSSSAVTESSF